jgi:DNA-binding SARP family transcriptional activator
MDASHSPEQHTSLDTSGTSSLTFLLEQGLTYVRRGPNAEGIATLAQISERLANHEAHFAAILDAFSQSHSSYSWAQEELLQASKRFARADSERQVQLAALENLLLILLQEMYEVTPNADRPVHQSKLPSPSEENTTLPALYITCFGHFDVKRLGRPVVLCSNNHGQTILRYLVAQSDHCATSDTLMELLWPDDGPEVAQPRLHTAICALRRSLNNGYSCEPGGGYIVCKNRTYCFSAAIQLQTDVEQFLHYYKAGRQKSAERVAFFEKACCMYSGPFLPEDKYADWSFLQREHLSRVYIDMCRTLADHYLKVRSYEDAEKWASAIIKEDHCDELAYRQLIQVFAAQGRRSEALQQYQHCERILREELAVQPLPETVHLFQMMLNSDPSPRDEVKI